MYSIHEMSQKSGVSKRALRYYDQIGLLHPKTIKENGYRLYGDQEVTKLQEILLYKYLGFSLQEIKMALLVDSRTRIDLFTHHAHKIQQRMQQNKQQLLLANEMIAQLKGEQAMTNDDKFEQMKKTLIANNDALYREELLRTYQPEAVQQTNLYWQNLSAETYQLLLHTEQELIHQLNELLLQPDADITGPKAKQVFLSHRKWLTLATSNYSVGYHRAMADLYKDDLRFSAYYDQKTLKPSTSLLCAIIYYYTTEETES